MKRVFIIHGWGGDPEEGWFPWLAQELRVRGFEVSVPEMPDTEAPVIDAWVGHLAALVGTPDKETFFVGHSIGGQAILRYLASIDVEVGGVVCVSCWLQLTGLETAEEEACAKPWLETPIAFSKVRQNAKRIIAIFSDDDAYVPMEDNVRGFTTALDPEIVIEHARGHFSRSSGIVELPSALAAVEKLAA